MYMDGFIFNGQLLCTSTIAVIDNKLQYLTLIFNSTRNDSNEMT